MFGLFTEVIVGVNKYRLKEQEEVDVLCIDNTQVREKQIARLKKTRETRDPKKVRTNIFQAVRSNFFHAQLS